MTLAEFRKVFEGPLIGELRLHPGNRGSAIEDKHADLISFGRTFISNPDLVERFEKGWPLNPPADQKSWYSFDEVGYTDFPRYGNKGRKSGASGRTKTRI